MFVIYSETHRQHSPTFEILEGGDKVPIFEKPARMDTILGALQQRDWAILRAPDDFGLAPILAVHAPDYVEYLQTGYPAWLAEGGQIGQSGADTLLLAAAFPPRRALGKPTSSAGRAGYYSFDLSCPIVAGTYAAALTAAHCALTGAQLIATGERAVFALCRPPGHHAGRDFAGGYCYFNNAAIAAAHLAADGSRVAVLDVDYHGGNGTQDIFYASAQVLTVSLHADPARQYPYFVGYADETGSDAGVGYHRNFPLPPATDDAHYLDRLEEALVLIREFAPRHLVLSFGADTFVDDPLGDLAITRAGFAAIGARIAALGLPTLIVMEGGYDIAALGENTCALLATFIV